MGILLNGNKPSKIIYNGAESSLYYNGSKIWPEETEFVPYVTIGTQQWSTVYVDQTLSGVTPYRKKKVHDILIGFYQYSELAWVVFPDGWRLATYNDINTLKTYLVNNGYNGSAVISTLDGGTDIYGLNLFLVGHFMKSNLTASDVATICMESSNSNDQRVYGLRVNSSSIASNIYSGSSTTLPVYSCFRLVRDVA